MFQYFFDCVPNHKPQKFIYIKYVSDDSCGHIFLLKVFGEKVLTYRYHLVIFPNWNQNRSTQHGILHTGCNMCIFMNFNELLR